MNEISTLAPNSRVWIYQSDRLFSQEEVNEINLVLENFCHQWAAHGKPLKSFAKVYYNCFVVLMVDESNVTASGCSIDSSVKVIREIMSKYKVDLLNRMIFAYLEDGEVKLSNRPDFIQKLKQGDISDDTIVFNNLVKDKLDFETQWKLPLAQSWHKQLV